LLISNLSKLKLAKLPLYNQDLEDNPQTKWKILLILSKCWWSSIYNCWIQLFDSRCFKNGIDWGSRQFGERKHAFFEKPVGIMSASMGVFGGVRAQLHLRQVCVFLNTYTMAQPEFICLLHTKNLMKMAFLMMNSQNVCLINFWAHTRIGSKNSKHSLKR